MISQWLWGLVKNIKAGFLLQGSFLVSFISYLHTMCYLVLFSEKYKQANEKQFSWVEDNIITERKGDSDYRYIFGFGI